jgi:hypothetical protein
MTNMFVAVPSCYGSPHGRYRAFALKWSTFNGGRGVRLDYCNGTTIDLFWNAARQGFEGESAVNQFHYEQTTKFLLRQVKPATAPLMNTCHAAVCGTGCSQPDNLTCY